VLASAGNAMAQEWGILMVVFTVRTLQHHQVRLPLDGGSAASACKSLANDLRQQC